MFLYVAGCGCSKKSASPEVPSRTVKFSEQIPVGFRCRSYERHPKLKSKKVPHFENLKDGFHVFDSAAAMTGAFSEHSPELAEESKLWAASLFGDNAARHIAIVLVSYSNRETSYIESVGNLGQMQASITFYGVGETTEFDHQYPLAVFTLDSTKGESGPRK